MVSRSLACRSRRAARRQEPAPREEQTAGSAAAPIGWQGRSWTRQPRAREDPASARKMPKAAPATEHRAGPAALASTGTPGHALDASDARRAGCARPDAGGMEDASSAGVSMGGRDAAVGAQTDGWGPVAGPGLTASLLSPMTAPRAASDSDRLANGAAWTIAPCCLRSVQRMTSISVSSGAAFATWESARTTSTTWSKKSSWCSTPGFTPWSGPSRCGAGSTASSAARSARTTARDVHARPEMRSSRRPAKSPISR